MCVVKEEDRVILKNCQFSPFNAGIFGKNLYTDIEYFLFILFCVSNSLLVVVLHTMYVQCNLIYLSLLAIYNLVLLFCIVNSSLTVCL